MVFTIGEAAERLGVPSSTVRYYDKEGLLPTLDRSAGGMRVFTEADISGLSMIGCLKKSGMSIKDIRQFMEWCQQGDDTLEKRQQMFHDRRDAVHAEMDELQHTLETIEYKCWFYDTAVARGSAQAVLDIPDDEIPENIRSYRDNI